MVVADIAWVVTATVTIIFTYGLIGLAGKDYDMPIAVLSTLVLGIGVDFAIQVHSRTEEEAALEAAQSLSSLDVDEPVHKTRRTGTQEFGSPAFMKATAPPKSPAPPEPEIEEDSDYGEVSLNVADADSIPAEDQRHRHHVLNAMVAVGRVVERPGLVDDSHAGFLRFNDDLLDVVDAVLNLRVQRHRSFDGCLRMELRRV